MASPKGSRFWTACPFCEKVHHYLISKEGLKRRCDSCKSQFVAVKVATMSINDYVRNPPADRKKTKASNNSNSDFENHDRELKMEESEIVSSNIAKNSYNSHLRKPKVEEGELGAFTVAESIFNNCNSKLKLNDSEMQASSITEVQFGHREVDKSETNTELMLIERTSGHFLKSEHNVYPSKKRDVKGKFSDKRRLSSSSSNNTKKPKRQKPSGNTTSIEDPTATIIDPCSIEVQDSDFYDFDLDRTADCIEEKQIWTIYDDNDGMPRLYALINKVVSRDPFEVQMTWLEGKDDNEKLYGWSNTGFWRTCGEFVVGRSTTTKYINVFAHLFQGVKLIDDRLKIFPRKGSVWALYKNWQAEWNEYTPKDAIQKYEVVEVVTDFTETLGASVSFLTKVDGFKSLYKKLQTGPQAIRWISRKEYLRFSHQIPARRLSGAEAENLPPGCWELDPSALPLDI